MRIALVAQHATTLPTGSTADHGQANESRLRELSRSLASSGHRVTVYAQRHGSTVPARTELEPGVTVEYIGSADGRADHFAEADLLRQVPEFQPPAARAVARRAPRRGARGALDQRTCRPCRRSRPADPRGADV